MATIEIGKSFACRCRRERLVDKLNRQKRTEKEPRDSGAPMVLLLCGGPVAYSVGWKKGTDLKSTQSEMFTNSLCLYGPLACKGKCHVRCGRQDKSYRASEYGWTGRDNENDPWVQVLRP